MYNIYIFIYLVVGCFNSAQLNISSISVESTVCNVYGMHTSISISIQCFCVSVHLLNRWLIGCQAQYTATLQQIINH